jgi:nucleoside-diphosphate-sugar epimerase
MKILFTGGSSFTGYWFIQELARAGHEVVAVFRRSPEDYPDELRRKRVTNGVKVCRPFFGMSFGDEEFLGLVRQEGGWDLFCHHAADVTNYRNPEFDVVAAVEKNTRNIGASLEAFQAAGCRKVLLTGSVFESDEGAGSEDLPAFSPYGLSKALTAQVFRFYTASAGLGLGKLVIPNPFGPYEEPRFTAYLMRQWFAGASADVNTPAYVRDNIHVSLLAKVYASFAQSLPLKPGFTKINPSGYAESQGAFTLRFAHEMRSRLGLPCEVSLKLQTEYREPRVRINTDIPDASALGWDEASAWDDIARYYKQQFGE